jgi:hypothetical protein
MSDKEHCGKRMPLICQQLQTLGAIFSSEADMLDRDGILQQVPSKVNSDIFERTWMLRKVLASYPAIYWTNAIICHNTSNNGLWEQIGQTELGREACSRGMTSREMYSSNV